MKLLKSERMNKVIITAPKSYLTRTIDVLHALKALHIIDHTKGEFDTGAPLKRSEEISGLLVAVRSLISTFRIKGNARPLGSLKSVGVKSLRQLDGMVQRLRKDASVHLDEISGIENRMSAIEIQMELVSTLQKIGLPLETYKEYASLSTFTGKVKNPALLKAELRTKIGEFELRHSAEGFIALFIPTEFRETATEILAHHSFAAIDASQIKELKGDPSKAFERLSSHQEKQLSAKRTAERKLHRIKSKWRDFLLASENFLSIELEKAEAPLRFAASENVFIVSGWVTRKKAVEVTGAVQEVARGNAHVSIMHPSEHDEVPVKMTNSGPVKPFEFLMKLYALPKYNEIDPTVFMFLTFPLFFGIILGDIGYGLVVALLAVLIWKKIPSARSLAGIIIPAALSSILFGFIYGEFFGIEVFGHPSENGAGHASGDTSLNFTFPLSRMHNIEEMLFVSLAIGLIHVNVGLLLGFFNELSHHGLRKAVLAKGSWWLLQAGAGLALASAGGFLNPSFLIPGVILAAAAVVMLTIGEPLEFVEIPGIASNILSYSRLMAVGLASVGLAAVVNGFVDALVDAGGFMIVVAILIGILGHGLNIALGILGGFLQSLRLHYVEFFTKFYKGGAVSFHPFGKIEKPGET